MISPEYLRDIVRVSITPLGWWSQEAEELLLMTAAHESGLGRYTRQIKGPALGLYMMEPGTLHDSYDNYLNYPGRTNLLQKIVKISGVQGPDLGQLQHNPIYATIMARLKYYRAPGALPPAADHWSLAEYAKKHYNSELGAARVADYFNAYRLLVLD